MILRKLVSHAIRRGKRQVSALLTSVDKHSRIDPRATLNRFVKIRNSLLGRYSYVGPRTTVENAEIGSFCSISWDCHIGLSSHTTNCVSTSPIFFEKYNGTGTSWVNTEPKTRVLRTTTVGHDVWIGAGCIVLEGIRVGHGAIIAAASVVTKDVQPYSIVGGVPAKHIRFRFPEEVIAALLGKAWWNAEEESILSSLEVFAMTAPTLNEVSRLPDGN